jgi:hypothetical protein
MWQMCANSLLEGIAEDLKIVQRQAIELHDAGTHEERLANATLLRVRVSALEQRIQIVRLMSTQVFRFWTRTSATLLFAFGAGWLARGWY